MITGAGTFQAAGALGKGHSRPLFGIQTGFLEHGGGVADLLLAVLADHADQPLRQDTVERRDKVVWLDAHIDEASNYVGDVVGVHGGENQVAGQSGLDGDLRGLLVADLAHHDLVGVVAQNGAEAAREGQALLFIHGNLGDAADLVFHRIFNGNNLVLVGFDLVDRGVKGGGFPGAGGPGDQHHAVGLANVAAELAHVFIREADDVEAEILELLGEGFLVQHAQHGVLAVNGGHDGYAEVHKASFITDAEAAVLRHAALGDIELAHHLDAGEDGGMPLLGDGGHGVLQDAVNAVFDDDLDVARLDVNVAGTAFERGEDHRVHQADHRADGGVAGQPVAGNRLFAFLLLLHHLEGESLGGLLEDALRLLRALEQVADLRRGSDLDDQLSPKQQLQLIAQQHLAGVGHGHHQGIVVRLERHKVEAKHQVGRDAAEEFRVDPLLAQVHKGTTVALGQPARALPFLLVIQLGWWAQVVFSGPHDSLFRRGRERKAEDGEIERYQDEGYHTAHEHQNQWFDHCDQSRKAQIDLLLIEFGHAAEHRGQRAAGLADFDHL